MAKSLRNFPRLPCGDNRQLQPERGKKEVILDLGVELIAEVDLNSEKDTLIQEPWFNTSR